jgi:hypothetical protein
VARSRGPLRNDPAVCDGVGNAGPDFYNMATGPGTVGGGPAGTATTKAQGWITLAWEFLKSKFLGAPEPDEDEACNDD